jgi:hypothetical protein
MVLNLKSNWRTGERIENNMVKNKLVKRTINRYLVAPIDVSVTINGKNNICSVGSKRLLVALNRGNFDQANNFRLKWYDEINNIRKIKRESFN